MITTMSIRPNFSTPEGSRSSSSTFFYDGYGWSCPHCTNTPYHLRAPGSFYSRGPPSTEFMEEHLSICAEAATASHQTWGHDRPLPPSYHSAYQQPYSSHPKPYYNPGTAPTPPEPQWHTGSYPNNEHHYYPPPYRHPDNMYPNNHPSAEAQRHFYSYSPSVHEETPRYRAIGPSDACYQEAITILSRFDEVLDNTNEVKLVLPEDKRHLTDYFYYINKQLKICRFTEDDRKTRGGKRDTIAVGFAGLECRHCAEGCASSRKFFWSDVDRLANSFSEIPGHILKCRKCPKNIKEALADLKKYHPEQMARLPRGSQKDFLRNMWERLHNPNFQEPLEENILSPAGVNELGSKHENRQSKNSSLNTSFAAQLEAETNASES